MFHIICEPMFLLLIAAAVIYFILREPRDWSIMLIFVIGIIGINVIQEWKVTSDNVANTRDYWRKDYCYAGTLVTEGAAVGLVDKIGANVASAPNEDIPLQKQTDSLVKICTGIAVVSVLWYETVKLVKKIIK